MASAGLSDEPRCPAAVCSSATMVRRAAVFGCNYAGSAHALHGCINDAHAIYEMLVYAYQFDPQVRVCRSLP